MSYPYYSPYQQYPYYSPFQQNPYYSPYQQTMFGLGNYVADFNNYSRMYDGFTYLDPANAQSQRRWGYNYGY
jgi:hypothetical protein